MGKLPPRMRAILEQIFLLHLFSGLLSVGRMGSSLAIFCVHQTRLMGKRGMRTLTSCLRSQLAFLRLRRLMIVAICGMSRPWGRGQQGLRSATSPRQTRVPVSGRGCCMTMMLVPTALLCERECPVLILMLVFVLLQFVLAFPPPLAASVEIMQQA